MLESKAEGGDQRIFGQFSENFRDSEGRKKDSAGVASPSSRGCLVHVRYLRAIDRNASGKEVNYFFAEHSVYASPVKPWPYHFVAVNQARSSPADPVRGSHRSGQIRRRNGLSRKIDEIASVYHRLERRADVWKEAALEQRGIAANSRDPRTRSF